MNIDPISISLLNWLKDNEKSQIKRLKMEEDKRNFPRTFISSDIDIKVQNELILG